MCVCVCARVRIICVVGTLEMYLTYLQCTWMRHMLVNTKTNTQAHTEVHTYLFLPSPQPSSHKACDTSSLLAFVFFKAVFQIRELNEVLCQVKEEGLARNGLHLGRQGRQWGQLHIS